jgi:hypothetical protein
MPARDQEIARRRLASELPWFGQGARVGGYGGGAGAGEFRRKRGRASPFHWSAACASAEAVWRPTIAGAS